MSNEAPVLIPKYGVFAECPFCCKEIYRARSDGFNDTTSAVEAVEEHRKTCPALSLLKRTAKG